MSERERQVNLALQALDDAHRLGRIARDEYRRCRRELLASLSDACITDRDTVRRPAAVGAPTGSSAHARRHRGRNFEEATATHARPASPWPQRLVFAGVMGVIGLGVVLFYWFVLREV
jgi:hypothetical protein